jgi:hypothetical protein
MRKFCCHPCWEIYPSLWSPIVYKRLGSPYAEEVATNRILVVALDLGEFLRGACKPYQ